MMRPVSRLFSCGILLIIASAFVQQAQSVSEERFTLSPRYSEIDQGRIPRDNILSGESSESPASSGVSTGVESSDILNDNLLTAKNLDEEGDGGHESGTAVTEDRTHDMDDSADNGNEPTNNVTMLTNLTETPSNESSPLKSLYVYAKKPGLGSSLTDPVFKGNMFVGLFNSCTSHVSNQVLSSVNDSACFLDDEYNDRLTFEMTYLTSGDVIEDAFEKHPPQLKLQDSISEVAGPTVSVTDVNKMASTAKVTIMYNCKTGSSGTISLVLDLWFGMSENSSLSIPWTKNCRTGKNKQIKFGYVLDNNNVNFNDTQVPAMTVTPSDVSTEVFLKLEQPGAQQAFLAPFVISSNPEITDVTVRGNHPSGGVLQGLEQTTFQVSYNCEQKGSTEIGVSVAIPPFDNLTTSWTKDCGGQPPMNLQIGTAIGSSDVVKNGEPTSSFLVGIQHIGTEHSDEHLHLPGNQSDWTVFLANTEDGASQPLEASLHVGRITLTVEHPENVAALDPRIKSKSALGWSEIPNSGYTLRPGSNLKLSLHFVCKRIAESRILVTIPILQYDTVEFGIAKRCTHVGKARKSSQLVFTAGNVMVIMAAACVAAVVVVIRRRNTQLKGFEALPVSEG